MKGITCCEGDTLPHALTSISTVKVYYGTFVHQKLTDYLVPPPPHPVSCPFGHFNQD